MNKDFSPDRPHPIGDELAVGFQHPVGELIAQLRQSQTVWASGLEGSYAAATLCQVAKATGTPLMVCTATYPDARCMASDLESLGAGRLDREVLLLPPPDVSPYGDISPNRNRVLTRLATQFRLAMGGGGRLVVLPLESLMRRLIPWSAIECVSTVLSVGQQNIDLTELRRSLVEAGYSVTPLVEDPGTFAIRGGLVDIYSPFEDYPVRIDLYGDEIEAIRLFDPQTQRTFEARDEIFILPVREEIRTERTLQRARLDIRRTADQLSLPSSQVNEMVRDLESGFPSFGIESFLPALHSLVEPWSFFDPRAIWVICQPDRLRDRSVEIWEQRQREYREFVDSGEFAYDPHRFYLQPDEVWSRVEATRPKLYLETLGGEDRPHVTFRCQTNHDVVRLRKMHDGTEGTVHALVTRLQDWRPTYGRIAFACRSSGSAERLAGLLRSYGQKVVSEEGPLDLEDLRPAPAEVLSIYTAPLSMGFRNPLLSLAVVADSEIFGRAARRTSARVVEEALAIGHFRELTAGDLVVHLDFGIAKYHGMEKLVLDGIAGDYLKLEFADNDKLYLPVHRLGRVQKYVSGERERLPTLDKLGGARWAKSKAKVREELEEIADELLRLYAERKTRKGHAYGFPTEYFREFEATFPFEETPHQQTAIEEVIQDMISPQPMDRLLCGDVGFGKTEVAIRASFLAVLDGVQVAVLVPTTILAEQHLRTFSERLRQFPIRIEALSRFRRSSETADILEALAAGRVDIVIGTHRILSKDVQFRQLGLLIIDEEQRFGVRHKEKLKQLKATVDVLTMTATPIPRTLEMSLLGIRDLSVILTPPNDRLAITTYVAQFKHQVIREGIEREMRRGGQVFFVHNRVRSIREIAKQIQEIVPDARIVVAHAQMSNTQLERVMLDFVNRKVDVLVCTTIIESGLDIANANTIFINRADTFGLSQLYQLRGRVGRGRERATCYLLVSGRRKLTPEAARRLEVIRTHTELASGISIAQHDLDLRGAGNLLGKDQSGHIRTVGYDLFCELLEETIREKRGEERPEVIEPEVNIPVEAYLPASFIPEEGLRLLFYKRLSLARDLDDLDRIVEEMADRFGRLPQPALTLREIIAIKIALTEMGIEAIEAGPHAILLRLSQRCRLAPAKVVDLVNRTQGRYLLRQDMQLIRRLGDKESQDLLVAVRTAVREIERCVA